MNLEKLRLKHFIGIKKGLGLDEIEIDFTGKTGLMALDGDNGKGKSTCLDSLHPWPLLASRDGSLYQHVTGREAEKELSFSFNGDLYRTLIKVDSQSERSEGFIWKNGTPEVNGKISTYTKYINGLFGSSTLFFASVFSAQNAEKMSAMRVGELKELFAEFLRLERYEKWADTEKQLANIYQGRAGDKDGRIKGLEEQSLMRPRIEKDLEIVGESSSSLSDDHTLLRQEILRKRSAVDTLKETITRNALALERRADLQGQIDRLERELAKEKVLAEEEIKEKSVKYLDIKAQLKAVDEVLKDREAIEQADEGRRKLEAELAEMQQAMDLLNQELPGHQAKVHEKETEISVLKQRVKDLEDDQELRTLAGISADLSIAIDKKKKEISDLIRDPQYAQLEYELKSLHAAAKVGDGIKADCKEIACAGIRNVLEAKERIPEVEKSIQRRAAEINSLKITVAEEIEILVSDLGGTAILTGNRKADIGAEKTALTEQLSTADHCLRNLQQVVVSATELITAKRQSIARFKLSIEKQKTLADRLPDVRVAEQRKADLDKQLQEVTDQGTNRKQAWLAKENAYNTGINKLADSLVEIKLDVTADSSLRTILQEITEIETVKIPAVEKEIQGARDRIATLQAELSKIEAAEKELEKVRDERDLLVRNASEWRYLQGVCGKNGLQAIEIAGSAPLICQYANDILSQAFGPLFQIELLTQDDEGRECLTINVIDEDGECAALDKKSGGEMVWCLMALRLGMTLLSKEKSERRFETFLSDEIDGPLSVEKAEQFINMYRAFMAVGGFKAAVFISHKPNCRAMADHILHFESGKQPYWG